MKAERLVIWIAETKEDAANEAEAEEVAGALRDIHLSKCGSVEIWKGLKPCKASVQRDSNTQHRDDQTGIYILFHSHRGAAPIDAKKIARYCVEKICAGRDANEITKIVFVVCNFAPDIEDSIAVKGMYVKDAKNSDVVQRQVLLQIMIALHKLNVRPKVVGWDQYISALPHVPTILMGGNNVARNINNSTRKKALTTAQIAAGKGSKFTTYIKSNRSKYGLVTPGDRQSHKRTFQISDDGKIHVTGPAGWSYD